MGGAYISATASIGCGLAQFQVSLTSAIASCTLKMKMTHEQHSLTVAMDQTTVQKCVGSQRCRMIAWMSKQAFNFNKRRKKLIPLPRSASFMTSKIMLMLTWRL